MSRSVLCAVDISNVGKDDQVLKTAKRLAVLTAHSLMLSPLFLISGKA